MPPFYLTPESIFILCNFIGSILILIYYISLPDKSYVSWIVTISGSITMSLILCLFFLQLPFPNPYLYTLRLWPRVLFVCLFIIALQIEYIFPSPMPYLYEAKIINRLLSIVIVVLIVVTLMTTTWGTTAQTIWLETGTRWVMLLCMIVGLLIWFRRIQVDLNLAGVALAPPTLIAPRPAPSIVLLTAAMIGMLFVAIPIVMPLWGQADLLTSGAEQVDGFFFTILLFSGVLAVVSYIPEATTVLVKLIGIGLFIVAIIFNILLLSLAPLVYDAYSPPHKMESKQAFRFVPIDEGRYQVSVLPDKQERWAKCFWGRFGHHVSAPPWEVRYPWLPKAPISPGQPPS